MDNYFHEFEGRVPPQPLTYSPTRELLWQFLATIALVVGGWYVGWRWLYSLNYDALWFAIPLVLAETLAYVGLILFVFNLWKDQPVIIPEAPERVEDVVADSPEAGRPISVDIFFTTYNEEPELVRLGIRDAKALEYPYPIDVRIHVLDDGRRPSMKAVTDEEGVGYIARTTNEGFKAGNLRNAMEQTEGDFMVICDADTRPLPTLLRRTMGHFRDPKVAWVQTPQWFYDLPGGESLTHALARRFGARGNKVGAVCEKLFGGIQLREDPFVNDPQMFYDVILRRRNWANASFCCGAGSIHRREAVMEAALRKFGDNVEARVAAAEEEITLESRERRVSAELMEAIRTEAVTGEVLTPYKFHVSEDIYTSIVLHSDRERGWKSVLHPMVESKMLSPQDLLTWTIQRYKYAGGSLDILFNDNPLFRPGLTFSQRMMYASTFYSYLGSIWNLVFLAAPIIYLFSGIAPVSAYTGDFFIHVIPFLVALELAMMVGTWGLAGYAAKASYLSFFPLGLRALWNVARGQKISFPVTPKDRQSGNFLSIVRPQLAVIMLTVASSLWAVGALLIGGTEHSTTGVVTNILWGINNCVAMAGMVTAALWTPSDKEDVSNELS